MVGRMAPRLLAHTTRELGPSMRTSHACAPPASAVPGRRSRSPLGSAKRGEREVPMPYTAVASLGSATRLAP